MNVFQKIWNRVTSFALRRRGGFAFIRDHVGGIFLTHEEALKLSAVWACVSVISKAIASSDWDIFLQKPNGDRDYQPNSRTYHLLNTRPNPEMTPLAFHEASMVVALLWGDSYAEIEYDIVGRPAALWPLDPERCELVRGFFDSNGRFQYDIKGTLHLRVTNYDRQDTFLPYNDVYHIHGMSIDGTCGLDLVSYAARTLLQALASEQFKLKFYQHGTTMGGVLQTEKDLDQKKLDDLKKNIKDRVSGVENAFEFLILGGGLKWQSLSQDFDKAQFIETNYYLIEEICRWFGVPPHKIAHLLRATFSNIEHQGIEFQRDSLRRWARLCEQEVDYKLLPAGPISVNINLEWAAEGDAKSKAETDAILVSNGLARRNELRKKRGQNSLGPEGELLTVQSNMTTLANIAKAPPPGTTQPRPATETPEEPAEPKENAVKALLIRGFRRYLKRQTNQAIDFARVRTEQLFAEKLDANSKQTLIYCQEQILEVMEICSKIGVHFRAGAYDFAQACFTEERSLLLEAYRTRNVANWIDIEQRASDLTKRIMTEGSIA